MAEKQAETENAVMTWENAELGTVHSLFVDDEPWFVAKDVAIALGYKNVRDAVKKHVDDEDKGVAKRDTLGGQQNVAIINESGLYALIFESQLDSAKKFKRWVTGEVLPAIRNRGIYGASPVVSVRELAGAIDKLTERVSALEQVAVKNALPDMADTRERVVELVRRAAMNSKSSERSVWYDLYTGYGKMTGIPIFKCAKALNMSAISFIDTIGHMESLLRFAEQVLWFV